MEILILSVSIANLILLIATGNEKRHPNGYVMNQGTKEVGGVIYCCPNYTGRFENKNVQLKLELTI